MTVRSKRSKTLVNTITLSILTLLLLALLRCNAVAVMFWGASSFCRPDVRMSGCKTGTPPTVFELRSSSPRIILTYP